MRPKARVFVFSRATEGDINLALDCGVDGIVLEFPMGEPRMLYQFAKYSEDDIIRMADRCAKYAKDKGLEVVLFPMDCTRARHEFFFRMLEVGRRAAGGGQHRPGGHDGQPDDAGHRVSDPPDEGDHGQAAGGPHAQRLRHERGRLAGRGHGRARRSSTPACAAWASARATRRWRRRPSPRRRSTGWRAASDSTSWAAWPTRCARSAASPSRRASPSWASARSRASPAWASTSSRSSRWCSSRSIRTWSGASRTTCWARRAAWRP